MRLELENTASRFIDVRLRGQSNGDFVVATPEGDEVWSRYNGAAPLANLDVRRLGAGERLVFTHVWTQLTSVDPRLRQKPLPVKPGHYLLSANLYFAERTERTPGRPLIITP